MGCTPTQTPTSAARTRVLPPPATPEHWTHCTMLLRPGASRTSQAHSHLSACFPVCIGQCPSAQGPLKTALRTPGPDVLARSKALTGIHCRKHPPSPDQGSVALGKPQGQGGRGCPALPTCHGGDRDGSGHTTKPGGADAELIEPLCCSMSTFMSLTCSRPPSPLPSAPHHIPQELGCHLPPALPRLHPAHQTTSSQEQIYSDPFLPYILYPSIACLSAAVSSAQAAFPACFTFSIHI